MGCRGRMEHKRARAHHLLPSFSTLSLNTTPNGRPMASATIDLLDGLMRVKDERGQQLSDVEVLDNIVSLVVAGYESTSVAIMWALYYLAKYPPVLETLREENMALSKNKNGEFITSDDVAKLIYTNKVVEETIRLANIAAIIFRKATKDVENKGYKIPKGWKLRWELLNPNANLSYLPNPKPMDGVEISFNKL
ncbi:hypothetical protein RJ640_005359 [Escallonia rubra]|uniref:Cytochrome P450 n=1 Tax=Escallonia rubra TaxID=112253 RepID=A0AA88QAZ8_9ASTE|nr:hypothetical protein RJ640_005359 [Escallonia rubra]